MCDDHISINPLLVPVQFLLRSGETFPQTERGLLPSASRVLRTSVAPNGPQTVGAHSAEMPWKNIYKGLMERSLQVSSVRWAWRQLSRPPPAPTVTFQRRSLFTVCGQLPAPLTSIRQPPAKGHLYMSLFN